MTMSRMRGRSQTRSSELLGQSSTAMGGWCTIPPGVVYYPPGNVYLASRQELAESCMDELHPGPPYRTGGPFFCKKLTLDLYHSQVVDLKWGYYRYNGRFALDATVASLQSIYNSYAPSATTYGATGFKKFRPVRSGAGMGQFLAELREFPQMAQVGLRKFQELGGAYLNYQFGWKPFLKDLKDFVETQQKIEKTIAFIRKNNGKWIKRGGTISRSSSTQVTSVASMFRPLLASAFYSAPGSPNQAGQAITFTVDNVWFKAKMKYYIPDLKVDKAENVYSSKLLRRLYGMDLTPDLAYQLIPFTWLHNWSANVGDIIANISSQSYDNLVAKYAYVMRHRMTKTVITESQHYAVAPPFCDSKLHVVNHGAPTTFPPITARAVITAECKERANATQWGFGNEGDQLTPRQAAILLALGISKV